MMLIQHDPMLALSTGVSFEPDCFEAFTLPSFTFSYMLGEDETRSYTVGYEIENTVFALRSEAGDTLSGEGIRNAFGEAFGEAWGDLRSRIGKKFYDLKNSWFGGCRAGSKVKCPSSVFATKKCQSYHLVCFSALTGLG